MIIGLTGGIGSGKSAAAKVFSDIGIDVVDADAIAREVVEPGTGALNQISEHFGPSVLSESGSLNRSRLRNVIFSDEKEREWLEELLHPLIRAEILNQARSSRSEYCILEAPLLFENGLEKSCSKTIAIDLPENMQIERASKRDTSTSQDIKKIMDAQIDRKTRLAKADYILDNSKDRLELGNQILRLDQILKLLSKTKDFQ